MDRKNHEQHFETAATEAQKALCLRDKCGAVVVLDGEIIGRGYNAPPKDDVSNRKCELDLAKSAKPKSDRTCCMHAEWRAIANAQKRATDLKGSTLYFTRIDDSGAIKKSGEPYCTVCSRLALDAGISNWALWQEKGITLFDAKTYNDLSYAFHIK